MLRQEMQKQMMHDKAMAAMPERLQHLVDKMWMEPSKFLASAPMRPTARIEDVFQDMHTGDGLWHEGTSLFALGIRVSDYTNVSHGGTVLRDSNTLESIRCMDTIESFCWKKGGGRNVSLVDEVKRAPGRWLWGPVADPYLEIDPKTGHTRFNRNEAEKAARELIGIVYGWRGIGLMAMTRLPFLRAITYALGYQKIDTAWEGQPPYCSWAQSIIATRAGVDPVPGRAPQLTAPAHTYQSLLWGSKIALT